MPKHLEIRASVSGWADVEAAPSGEKKLRRFAMVAYTGVPMTVRGWAHPVVVDLSGLQISAKSRPIYRDHGSGHIVGHTDNVRIEEGVLRVAGVVSGAGPAAREVIISSENGFPWQASMGAKVLAEEFVPDGKKALANGRSFEGPLVIARRAVLGEVSFVAQGADDDTSAAVIAHANARETNTMNFEQWLEAQGFTAGTLDEKQRTSLRALFERTEKPESAPPTTANPGYDDPLTRYRAELAAETKRVNAIRKACAGKHADLEAQAIAEGWDLNRTELEVIRAERPKAPGILHGATEAPSDTVLEAAVCLAARLDNAEKQYTEPTLEAAHKRFKERIGLQELLLEAAWRNGFTGRSFKADIRGVLQAAFSTLSLPGIFSNVANKFLLQGFDSIESAWRAIAAIANVSDFKQITRYRLTGGMEYEEVGPDGELKHGEVGEMAYANQAKTYGKMFSITRQDQINDDLGALTGTPKRLGLGSAMKFNDVFWRTYLNNAAFFAAGNKNYMLGADTALSIDGLTKAEQLFLDQTDPDGNPLAVTPSILLVPNALNVTASQLTQSTELREDGNTAAKKYAISNPHAGKFQPVRSSYLSNPQYAGFSTKAWYLLADANVLPVIEACFLNGQQTPTVESADADFNVLGIQMRGYHDFGVALQEPRGGIKSKGEA